MHNAKCQCTTFNIMFPESGSEKKLSANTFSCRGILKTNEPVIYNVAQAFGGIDSAFTFIPINLERPFLLPFIVVQETWLQLDAYITDITVLREQQRTNHEILSSECEQNANTNVACENDANVACENDVNV